MEKLKPVTPGEILKKEFLEPLNISQSKLAGDLDIPVSRVNDIIKGTQAVTVDTAIRLAEYFGNGVRFWLNLQINYELEMKKRNGEYGKITVRIRKQAACSSLLA